MGFVTNIAIILGAPEQAIRLLLSLLCGYPFLYIHHLYLKKKNSLIQHLYFICCGLFLALFNYGFNFIHSVICIVSTWLLLNAIGGTLLSVVISFLFNMGYLLYGYVAVSTDTYDFTWTMAHCVLTLRLIALTFDVYDGKKDFKDLSKDQQKTSLERVPSLLEIASQAYFPASFMVGPQFSMRRFLDFVNGKLYPENTPSPITIGILRGCVGLLFLGIYQIGAIFVSDSFLLSDRYNELGFFSKLFFIGLWGKITLYKYISCWLITEGACILSGLSYSGVGTDGEPQWKGCANVKITLLETSTKFEQMIASFNINTNAWVAQYVYKRLKFLNNKYLSQFGVLFFLAVWHGIHSGYYATFFLEFLVMFFEKGFASILNKYPSVVTRLKSPPLSYAVIILMKCYVFVFMGYCLAAFVLLRSSRYLAFYSSVYYIGHVVFGGWILYAPLVKIIFKSIFGRHREESADDGQKNKSD